MTLHDFVEGGGEWPKESIGLRVGFNGRVIWTCAYYPDGCNGNRVQVSRLVHENGETFTRVAWYDRDTPIVFVFKEGK